MKDTTKIISSTTIISNVVEDVQSLKSGGSMTFVYVIGILFIKK